jgi:hypothetical protein
MSREEPIVAWYRNRVDVAVRGSLRAHEGINRDMQDGEDQSGRKGILFILSIPVV